MSQVMNNTTSVESIQSIVDSITQSGKNYYRYIHEVIESAKNSGNLEPENYDQIMSGQYLGGEFQQVYYETYEDQTSKMNRFLEEILKKINDYLKIV